MSVSPPPPYKSRVYVVLNANIPLSPPPPPATEDVSSVPLSVPEEVHTSAAADDVTEAVGDVTVADVSLSTLLGEHAEVGRS